MSKRRRPIQTDTVAESADASREMMKLVSRQAEAGDDICASLLSLENLANSTPYGSFIVSTADYDEGDSEVDDE